MGFSDEDFAKAEAVNSNTQLYKQAGNSIVVDVIAHIFTNIPKGAKTGTQSLKNRIEKAKIPEELCQHIVDICEKANIDDDGKILIDGKFTSVYLCDRKDKCNKSNYCGKECRFTFNEEHREPQLSMFD